MTKFHAGARCGVRERGAPQRALRGPFEARGPVQGPRSPRPKAGSGSGRSDTEVPCAADNDEQNSELNVNPVQLSVQQVRYTAYDGTSVCRIEDPCCCIQVFQDTLHFVGDRL